MNLTPEQGRKVQVGYGHLLIGHQFRNDDLSNAASISFDCVRNRWGQLEMVGQYMVAHAYVAGSDSPRVAHDNRVSMDDGWIVAS